MKPPRTNGFNFANPLTASLMIGIKNLWALHEGGGAYARTLVLQRLSTDFLTITGSPWVPTPFGSGVSFDGTSGTRLTLASNSGVLVNGASMTLAVLFRFDDLSARSDFCGKWHTTGNLRNYILLQGVTSTKAQFFIAADSAGATANSGVGPAMSVGQWYLIVGSWNETTKDCKLYVNGRLENSSNNPGVTLFAGGADFQIGSEGDETFPATGACAFCALWGRELTAGENLILASTVLDNSWFFLNRPSNDFAYASSSVINPSRLRVAYGPIIGGSSRVAGGLIGG